ncbi:hypothetical protein RIR_jg32337.t1 [Rhizophagus irregularis DAOM 181602=DAOM 197198]|nr:hypothetical protein RIR_jg32337.t1 [Rhizophagus irregularis DAOM 181602=DAOM 197198]
MTVVKAVLAIHKENLSSNDIIDANPSLDCINLGNNTSNISLLNYKIAAFTALEKLPDEHVLLSTPHLRLHYRNSEVKNVGLKAEFFLKKVIA